MGLLRRVLGLPLWVHLTLAAVLTLSGILLLGFVSLWFSLLLVPAFAHAFMSVLKLQPDERDAGL